MRDKTKTTSANPVDIFNEARGAGLDKLTRSRLLFKF